MIIRVKGLLWTELCSAKIHIWKPQTQYSVTIFGYMALIEVLKAK